MEKIKFLITLETEEMLKKLKSYYKCKREDVVEELILGRRYQSKKIAEEVSEDGCESKPEEDNLKRIFLELSDDSIKKLKKISKTQEIGYGEILMTLVSNEYRKLEKKIVKGEHGELSININNEVEENEPANVLKTKGITEDEENMNKVEGLNIDNDAQTDFVSKLYDPLLFVVLKDNQQYITLIRKNQELAMSQLDWEEVKIKRMILDVLKSDEHPDGTGFVLDILLHVQSVLLEIKKDILLGEYNEKEHEC